MKPLDTLLPDLKYPFVACIFKWKEFDYRLGTPGALTSAAVKNCDELRRMAERSTIRIVEFQGMSSEVFLQ